MQTFTLQATTALVLALLLASPVAAQSSSTEISFSGLSWSANGQVRAGKAEDGGQVLQFRSGSAELIGSDFENGTIEFDARAEPGRYFFGVDFRAHGANRESFYMRPHQSGRFDAMQYTPVFNNNSAWQLYPEHNAAEEIPLNRWFHVKLQIAGPRLEVFLDDAKQPSLTVPVLEGGRSRGTLLLHSFVPPGLPEAQYPVSFANFEVRPDEKPFDYPKPKPPTPESGFVDTWAVSSTSPEQGPPTEYPSLDRPWRLAPADQEGRLNLARWVSPAGTSRGNMLARVVLDSDAARTVRLGFGFSDRAVMFLNGKPVFQGDNTYLSRSKRYLGVMGAANDILFLELRAGANELLFSVSETFGGWGLTARLSDMDGVTVRGEIPSGASVFPLNE